MFVDDLLQRVFIGETDHLLDDLAAFEQQQRRNAAHAEPVRRRRVFVHVHLRHDQTAVVVGRQLVDRGRQPAARAAPFRPEINENDLAAVDRLFEVAVGQRLYLVGCHVSPLGSPFPYTL